MKNTPPRPSIPQRPNDELLTDLCTELREVACRDYDLPHDERVKGYIQRVVDIYKELELRHVDWRSRLRQLSKETKWMMPDLLEDCLAFPERLPFVREADGLRRALRCHLCQKAERPIDAKLFWYCDECLKRVSEAVRTRNPIPGLLLYRTYNPDYRCSHADADTVLASEICEYEGFSHGVCNQCIQEELVRRRTT